MHHRLGLVLVGHPRHPQGEEGRQGEAGLGRSLAGRLLEQRITREVNEKFRSVAAAAALDLFGRGQRVMDHTLLHFLSSVTVTILSAGRGTIANQNQSRC